MEQTFRLQLSIAKKAQDDLFAKYGDPRDQAKYQSKWCIIWKINQDHTWFPAIKVMINKDFKVKFQKLLRLLEARGLTGEIRKYCGCFEARNSRTTSLLSLHYWAAAIDLNCNREPLGSKTTHFTPEFIKCIYEAGLYWGGNFVHTKDPMHIALFNG